jgi:hypothetical protein
MRDKCRAPAIEWQPKAPEPKRRKAREANGST